MVISEVMTREVRVATPDDTLQRVARVMEEEDVGIVSLGDLALSKPTSAGDALQSIAEAPPSSANQHQTAQKSRARK